MTEKLKLFFGSLEDRNYLNKQHNRIQFGANLRWKVFYAGLTLKNDVLTHSKLPFSIILFHQWEACGTVCICSDSLLCLYCICIVLWSCVRDVSWVLTFGLWNLSIMLHRCLCPPPLLSVCHIELQVRVSVFDWGWGWATHKHKHTSRASTATKALC